MKILLGSGTSRVYMTACLRDPNRNPDLDIELIADPALQASRDFVAVVGPRSRLIQ